MAKWIDGCFAVVGDWALNGQNQSIWFVRRTSLIFAFISKEEACDAFCMS